MTALVIGCSQQDDLPLNASDPGADSETMELVNTSRPDLGDDPTVSAATEESGGTTTTASSESAADVMPEDESQEQSINQVSPEATRSEGSSSWAVVVAGASDPYDNLLEDAVTELGAAGFSAQITSCDVGAAQALQMSPTSTFTVSVYYDSEAAATQGVTDLGSFGITGVATQIETSCPE